MPAPTAPTRTDAPTAGPRVNAPEPEHRTVKLDDVAAVLTAAGMPCEPRHGGGDVWDLVAGLPGHGPRRLTAVGPFFAPADDVRGAWAWADDVAVGDADDGATDALRFTTDVDGASPETIAAAVVAWDRQHHR